MIKVGDLVELRSGSPPCLVISVRGDTVTIQAWNRDGDPIEVDLPVACVRLRSSIGGMA